MFFFPCWIVHNLPGLIYSPENMARASVTYNMIIEGVLAETGYMVFNKALVANNIMPRMIEFTTKLKQDESRHIA